jgi:hypothetical protein
MGKLYVTLFLQGYRTERKKRSLHGREFKERKFMATRVHIAVGARNYPFCKDIALLTYFHSLLDPVAVD